MSSAVADGLVAAVKAAAAFGDRVWLSHHVPSNVATFPYASVLFPVDDVPALLGDVRTLARRQDAQVDVWQDRKSDDDAVWESVRDALDGIRLGTSSGVLRCRYAGVVPLLDDDEGAKVKLTGRAILLRIDSVA